MCGKGSSSSGGYAAGLPVAQQNFTQASPEAMGWYRNAMNMANQAVARPYQQFGTQASDFVAQLNAQQQGAQQGLQGIAGGYQPYAAQAGQMMANAGQANAAQLAANQYMNPFMSQVVDPVKAALGQQQGQQLSQQQTEAIKGGAFGGERAGLQRQLLRGQQNLATGQALSPLYQTGYGQALGAAQADLARQLQAGQQIGAQGMQAQQASLGAGTLGQQTAQAGIDALRQQFQQQQMFPYMQAQFLSGIAGGLGPLMGQTTTQTQAQNPFGMFLAQGGAVEEDGTRMGGAVTEGGDYARGGYIRGGVSYGGDDIGSILSAQERMYDDNLKADTTMPTGEVHAAQGLKPAEFAAQPAKKSGLQSLADLAKTGVGIAGGLKSLFSSGNESSAADSGMRGTTGALGDMIVPTFGKDAEEDSGSGILGTLGKLGLSAAANYFLPGSGALTSFFADGGEVRPHYEYGGAGMSNDQQLGYVARTMLREDPTNMEAIGHVIRNRLQSGRWGDTPQSVVTSPKQFTPWNKEMVGTKADPRLISETDPRYVKALGAARNVFSGQSEDPTGGALNFYNPKLASPKWGPGMSNAIKIGEHVYGTAGGAGKGVSPTEKDRSWMASTVPSAASTVAGVLPRTRGILPEKDEKLGDYLTDESFALPALAGLASGVSGMLGSKSRYLGTALAQGAAEGIGAGAKSSMEVQKQRADIERAKAEAGLLGEEAKKVPVSAFKEMLEARNMGIQKFDFGGGPVYVVTLEDGSQLPLDEWMTKGGKLLGGGAAEAMAKRLYQESAGAAATPKAPTDVEAAPEGKTIPVEQAPQTPAATKPIISPVAPPPPPPGINVEGVQDLAAAERKKFMGPQADINKKISDNYIAGVTQEANDAYDARMFHQDMAKIIAEAAKNKGLNTPGIGFEKTSAIVGTLNRLASAAGLPQDYFGDARTKNDLVEKLNRISGFRASSDAGQHSLEALRTNIASLPDLSKTPSAAAETAADNIMNNKIAIDKQRHAKYYGSVTGDRYAFAGQHFNEKNREKFTRERNAIRDLILGKVPNLPKGKVVNPGKVLEKFMTAKPENAGEIDRFFKDHYNLDNMSGYFVGAQ